MKREHFSTAERGGIMIKKERVPPRYYIILLHLIVLLSALSLNLSGSRFFGYELNEKVARIFIPTFFFLILFCTLTFLIINLYLYFKIGMRIKGKSFVTVKKINFYDFYPILILIIIGAAIIFYLTEILQIYLSFSTLSIWILSYILFILIYIITYFVAKEKRKR